LFILAIIHRRRKMYFFLMVVLRLLKISALMVLMLLSGLYLYDLLILRIFEPAGSVLHNPSDVLWWFFVTITTVGYGDIIPASTYGRFLAGVPTMFVGIGLMGILIAKIADSVYETLRRAKMGYTSYNLKDHLVIIGYLPEYTLEILDQIRVFGRWKPGQIVLVADIDQAEDCPLENVHYVRGRLTDQNTLLRASVHKAQTVLIYGRNDSESVSCSVLVKDLLCGRLDEAHIVAVFYYMNMIDVIKTATDKRAECVLAGQTDVISKCIITPSSSRLLRTLVKNHEHTTIQRLDIPPGDQAWDYDELMFYLLKNYRVTVIGYGDSSSPNTKTYLNPPEGGKTIKAGQCLFYQAAEQIQNPEFPPPIQT
jgi:voltage-gated potassium channel